MIEKNNFSYKDSSARVVEHNSIYFRYIFFEYKEEYDYLMNSGLYQELCQEGFLISHEEIDFDNTELNVYKLLLPIQIPVLSYPFEWSFVQWKKVILSYLKINLVCLKYGMILKDATPYNFYLHNGKAILLDTSSFMFFKSNDNWNAYKQFCEEFVAPFSLMYYNGPEWSKLTMSCLKGINLKFSKRQLPYKSLFNLFTFLNIHLHVKFLSQPNNNNKIKSKKGFSVSNLVFFHKFMVESIEKWEIGSLDNFKWTRYYEIDIESRDYLDSKELFIREILSKICPKSILDLGANTGKFSFIASEYSSKVIALESDYHCVDLIESQIETSKNSSVFTLNAKIPEFCNGLGLNGLEVIELSSRVKSELVLALALVHHLFFIEFLSFNQIIEQLFKLCDHFVIVEFVPADDPKVKLLVNSRYNLLLNYNELEFECAFNDKFSIKDKKVLNNSSRIIYFLEKKI